MQSGYSPRLGVDLEARVSLKYSRVNTSDPTTSLKQYQADFCHRDCEKPTLNSLAYGRYTFVNVDVMGGRHSRRSPDVIQAEGRADLAPLIDNKGIRQFPSAAELCERRHNEASSDIFTIYIL